MSLSRFCAEMHRLAAIIDMPENYLASCGGEPSGGYHLALSADAARYVLSYSEKNDAEIIIDSADADAVMEALFVVATENWAPATLNDDREVGPEEVNRLLATPMGDLRAMAMIHHAQTGKAQGELLGRLNPAWRERQALKNAQRARSIRDVFDR